MIAERLAAQLLTGAPARDTVEVADRLLAVQAQDPRGVRLAVRARTSGLRSADVDRSLGVDRSVVITWLNRGTLHLVCTADYWWLHTLTTPPLLAGSARRLAQEGVTPDQADTGVRVVRRELSRHGPRTRPQLRDAVAAAGVPVERQALIHVLYLASLRGEIVRGPMIGREQAYVGVRDWLGEAPKPLDHDDAVAELARRYLIGHGPASDRDLAKWAGLPLRDARRGLALIAPVLEQRDDGLVDLRERRPAAGLPPPRLLGAFEPLLLGWTSREPILGANEQALVTDNGLFRAFALVGGRAMATWSMRSRSGRLRPEDVSLAPFGRLTAAQRRALEADAADVVRFLGGD